jgi:hypothetical protein
MRRLLGMLAAATVAALLGGALAGCSAPAEPAPDVSVKVYQLRSDYAVRGAQIEITNHGSTDLTITSARYGSAWFATTVSSPSAPNPVDAKSTVDFRVSLSAGRCSARKSADVVHLGFTRADGTTGTATIVPTIPFDSISLVHAQDCSREEFEKVATISIAPSLRFDPALAPGQADTGQRSALLDITLTPTGAPGSVTLHSTEDTTLLAQREGTIRSIEATVTAASPPTTITLDFVPEGCLEHRVAEDKVGTLIPMRVDAGPYHDALFSVPVPPAVKAALMDWVGVYCGW